MDSLKHYYDQDHLTKRNLTYTQHLCSGLINSFYLILGGILGIVHSICPYVLINVQTDTVSLVGKLLNTKSDKHDKSDNMPAKTNTD